MFDVILDNLPDHSFYLFGTSLKYEGPRAPTVRTVITIDNDIPESGDFLENAEEEQESEEELDEFVPGRDGRKVNEVITDYRFISGGNYFCNSKFNIPSKLTASPAYYLFYFLPVDFIKDVIPNVNSQARSVNHN
jgi:hypothetical protein